MKKLNNIEKAMLGAIKHRRITRRELMQIFNIDSRECMAIIRTLRKAGYPIVASKSGSNGGFYMADSNEELEKWISAYFKEVDDMTRIFKSMREGFE